MTPKQPVRERRRGGGQGRGWHREPIDLLEPETGPFWWVAWWREERVEGRAPNEAAAIAAIEHFRYRGEV